MTRFALGKHLSRDGRTYNPGELSSDQWMSESIMALDDAEGTDDAALRSVEIARAHCFARFSVAAAIAEGAMLAHEDAVGL